MSLGIIMITSNNVNMKQYDVVSPLQKIMSLYLNINRFETGVNHKYEIDMFGGFCSTRTGY